MKMMRTEAMTRVVLVAAFALSIAACKKQDVPTPTPEPKAAETEVIQSDSGTTTTFAPPAEAPQAAPAAN
jgi:ABC-type uncharacterized transport system auxiliary subunit